MSLPSFARLLASLALCLAVGYLGALATYPEIAGWYMALAKPAWTPPNWVFPVVWNILYVAMAVSLWLAWDRAAPSPRRIKTITLFAVQLALNAAWSPVFFGLHQVWLGLAIILVLIAAVAATIRAMWPVQALAAALLVPYLAWIVYAATLNAGIAVLNP